MDEDEENEGNNVDLDAIFDQSKPSFPPLNPQALFVSFQV
jgi:hypothetical protein